ncbi:MAG: VanZ family protein [Isosphaeraceae bacterium]
MMGDASEIPTAEHAHQKPSALRALWPILAALVWCGLIAASSSRVIFTREFLAWFSDHIIRDEANMRRFAVFWGYGWFAIVKGLHATEFAILTLLTNAAMGRVSPEKPGRNLALSAGFGVLFAISDEYHQTFVPGRGGNALDVLIDCLGIGMACALASRLRREKPRREPLVER